MKNELLIISINEWFNTTTNFRQAEGEFRRSKQFHLTSPTKNRYFNSVPDRLILHHLSSISEREMFSI